MKQKAINEFITQFQGQTFSSPKDVEQYLREHISVLVEDIYKEELQLADDRWKRAEEKLDNIE